ncbi:MAG: hypothetical protein QOH46_1150 [Solirubrobacteraceae bacterium]|nr:hypothetical protein [Solirubrobacteraceae bacterium]
MAESEERVGFTEATFRRVNEGIERGSAEGPVVFICECGRVGCNQLIELSRATYKAVRAHPRRFFLIPGHELPDAEDVVERHERYVVVQKRGEAGAVAGRTDPRRPLEP